MLRSAKALSKYTEMVDQVIRQQKDKLEAASDEARLRLREWDMPEALQVHAGPNDSAVYMVLVSGLLLCNISISHVVSRQKSA